MKKAMLLICGVIFFAGCANRIDPTPGDKCKPKWYKKEYSSENVVYGYSVEKSMDASTAAGLGAMSAQIEALKQINTRIKQEIGKAINEKEKVIGSERVIDFTRAVENKMKLKLDEPCNFCTIIEQEECEDKGFLVVYTKVNVDVNKYLDQNLRNRLDKLLEDPDKLLEELKEF